MNRVIYTFALVLTIISSSRAQKNDAANKDIAIVQAFISDVNNPSIRADVILAKHVQIEKTTSNEGYDYLEASINEIRLNLQTKNVDNITYIPFDELSRRETDDIDPEGKPTNKMYFLYYKNRQMLAVYIENDRIASFTLVSKGNKIAHFVTY
ncbi:hypothetical protein HP439_00405 [Sphingobacterium shayense]|uniref:hypothetical protein n=1 Tax=Sphingobacterium shayense TaxID=626343 RepID=UPI00155753F3|nr:hypothetical protein [Sphingobacterium shayense]NQD69180.1 hypothetical protein [Sphingobacterium shayense]